LAIALPSLPTRLQLAGGETAAMRPLCIGDVHRAAASDGQSVGVATDQSWSSPPGARRLVDFSQTALSLDYTASGVDGDAVRERTPSTRQRPTSASSFWMRYSGVRHVQLPCESRPAGGQMNSPGLSHAAPRAKRLTVG